MKLPILLGFRPKVKRIFEDVSQIILRREICTSQFCHSTSIPHVNSPEGSKGLRVPFTSEHKETPLAYLRVIGSKIVGTSGSLVVYSKHKPTEDQANTWYSYLFNCGEITSHHLSSESQHLWGSSALFITSNTMSNITGVSELLLRREDSPRLSKRIYTIYGPDGLDSVVELSASRKQLKLNYIPVKDKMTINFGKNATIEAIPILPSTEYRADPTKCAVAYICKLEPLNGYISVEDIMKTGIPPGTWIRQLQEGESVELPNGSTWRPEQFKWTHAYKRTMFIVIDIPSTFHLDALLSCTEFEPHQAGPGKRDEDLPEVIVHFTPSHVMNDPRYREWASTFSPSVVHIVVDEKENFAEKLRTFHRLQIKLNHLLPHVFPMSHKDTLQSQTHNKFDFNGPVVQSSMKPLYHLRPNDKFDVFEKQDINPQHVIRTSFSAEVNAAVMQMKTKFEQVRAQQPTQSKAYPRVLFLGTGSPPPSTTRLNSSILVHTRNDACLMLDCGTGTYNQIVKSMGSEATERTLRQLKLVYVSHIHFDHHGGLAGLLSKRKDAFKHAGIKVPRLYLLLPDVYVMHHLIAPCLLCDESIMKNVVIVKNFELMHGSRFPHTQRPFSEMCAMLGLVKLDLCFVTHIKNSFGIAITHATGWKLTYSGDTRPSKNLIKIGMNSDLLIHEATFQDELYDHAAMKRHCTVSEAIDVARDMRARFTILTHFSRRYGKVPVMASCPKDVGIAFDLMRVTFDDLPYLPHLYPVFEQLFVESLTKLRKKIHFDMNED